MSHDLESRFDRAMKKADKFEAHSKALHRAKMTVLSRPHRDSSGKKIRHEPKGKYGEYLKGKNQIS